MLFLKLVILSTLIWLIYHYWGFRQQQSDFEKQHQDSGDKHQEKLQKQAFANQQHMYASLHERKIPHHNLKRLKYINPQNLGLHKKIVKEPEIWDQTYNKKNVGGSYAGNAQIKKKRRIPKP